MAKQSEPTQVPPLPRPTIAVAPERQGYSTAGGDLDMLVTVAVDMPAVAVDRKPLNLALVIDRSGSMSGAPLESAKAAAVVAIQMLMPGDWVSVVAYDNNVIIPVPLTKVGSDRRALVDAVAAIAPAGSTDLFAGWAEGLSQVMSCAETDVVSRVVLLSDGMANAGVTDRAAICADAANAHVHGYSTTTLGFGSHYDELLMRGMADDGGGNYAFIESPAQAVEVFELELAGVSALRGRQVRLWAQGKGVTIAPVAKTLRIGPDGIDLPDIVAGMPGDYLVRATFAAGAEPPTLVLRWHDVLANTYDEVRFEVALSALDPAEVAALPLDARVDSARKRLAIADLKVDLGAAARRWDADAVEALLDMILAIATSISVPEDRQEELNEHQRLAQLKVDMEMTARASMQFAREKHRGASNEKRMAMMDLEKKWRYAKVGTPPGGRSAFDPSSRTASAVMSQPTTAGSVSALFSVTRPDGSTAAIEVVVGDIVEQHLDAMINPTNRGLFGVAGIDGAVHRRGGPLLTKAARSLGRIEYGEAAFTPGFGLPYQYVIHTASPHWGETGRELETLALSYRASFALAEKLGVRSLAVPAIGTGSNRYPKGPAVTVMVDETLAWLTQRGGCAQVRLVLDASVAPIVEKALEQTAR